MLASSSMPYRTNTASRNDPKDLKRTLYKCPFFCLKDSYLKKNLCGIFKISLVAEFLKIGYASGCSFRTTMGR